MFNISYRCIYWHKAVWFVFSPAGGARGQYVSQTTLRIHSPVLSIPICLTVWICSSTFIIHPTPFVVIGFILFAVAVIAAVLTCVVTFKTFQSHSGAGETSYTVRGTGLRILVVAMGSLWLLYFPFFVWFCVLLGEDLKGFSHTASMFVCIMGFRVVGDPLLCLLVWRENTQRQA